ncbi:MAG: hypothetical protein K1X87_12305 [Dehalococcoidia bacterium]|nr:hypothetical protein [Dehalococcoidia bacterium]HRC63396.1 hypothetical protein [Dehalococcoidia bacterium]
MADDDWVTSTEGDLDPDLTEEAGYSGWDPPDRSGWALVQRLVMALVLVSIVGGALLILAR